MKNNILNALALLASYLVLFFLPRELNVTSYVILGISIFLFIVGYCRLNNIFYDLTKLIGYAATNSLSVIIGISGMIFGTVYLYSRSMNGKSMVIFFLLMMEGLVIMGTSAGETFSLKIDRSLSVIVRIVALALFISGAIYVCTDIVSKVGTFVLVGIQSALLWIMGSSMTHRERISGLKTPIAELYNKLARKDTPLGLPKLSDFGKYKECLVYGPDDKGIIVCGYYKFGQFFISLESQDNRDIKFEDAGVLDKYEEMFKDLATK